MCASIGFTSPTITRESICPYFATTFSHGPDDTHIEQADESCLGFHRFSVIRLQSPHLGGDMSVYSGELYGLRPLKEELKEKDCAFVFESDCELIPPLHKEFGVDMFEKLDAEFARIIYEAKNPVWLCKW